MCGQPLARAGGVLPDAALLPGLHDAFASGASFAAETQCQRRAGATFWGELTLSPVLDGDAPPPRDPEATRLPLLTPESALLLELEPIKGGKTHG